MASCVDDVQIAGKLSFLYKFGTAYLDDYTIVEI